MPNTVPSSYRNIAGQGLGNVANAQNPAPNSRSFPHPGEDLFHTAHRAFDRKGRLSPVGDLFLCYSMPLARQQGGALRTGMRGVRRASWANDLQCMGSNAHRLGAFLADE